MTDHNIPVALLPPKPAIYVRQAIPDDLAALLACCWQERGEDVGAWLLSRAARNRSNRRGESLVILDDNGEPCGYGQLTLWPRCAEISDLVVALPYRSRGYGTTLIQHLVREAVRLGAPCVEIGAAHSNPRAIALYHRLGFVDHRTLEMNLGDTKREPVTYMVLQLPKQGE